MDEPKWCISTDDDEDGDGLTHVSLRDSCSQESAGAYFTPAQLRRFAEHLVSAAEWIEKGRG